MDVTMMAPTKRGCWDTAFDYNKSETDGHVCFMFHNDVGQGLGGGKWECSDVWPKQ
jgi:hypothetical protein